MYKKILTTDRWPNRAISPTPFDGNYDGQDIVVLHPGWGKRPEMHSDLLHELTQSGFRAIGLDTRYGYSDQGGAKRVRNLQRVRVGNTNPFFDVQNSTQNRYFYRRPAGLLQACVDLGIEDMAYIGHSEGGRIGLTAALADRLPVRFRQMVIVNGVGTGQAQGLRGLIRANADAVRDRTESEASTAEALYSFRDSAVHFVTHLRRTMREAGVIQTYDAWPDIGQLSGRVDQITVINARDDTLIRFEDAEARSKEYPEVKFVPSEGSHSNIYESAVRQLIIPELAK